MGQIYNIDIKSLMLLPANVYYLDTECRVLGFNSNTASLFNLTPEECIGLNYDEMEKIGNWTNGQGQFYQTCDMEVMVKKMPKIGVIEPLLPHPDGRHRQYISTRIPLHNQDAKVVGVFGISIEASNIHCLEQSTLNRNLKSQLANLDTVEFNNSLKLSKQQIECLQWLVKGMSIKQIAKVMDLSPRTIESYIENIKIKLRCTSRFELIEKALKMTIIQNKILGK